MMISRRDALKTGSAALALLSSDELLAGAQNTIRLGGSVPMSGKESDTGLNVLEGYRVAVKYVNERLGGVKIGGTTYKLELQLFDDASDPQRAVTLIQRQLDSGTDFFLGSFSSAIVLPTAALTERARRPMVQAGGGADQIFTRHFRYMFGIYPRASRQLVTLVEMFKSMQGQIRTCAIVATNDPFSKGQADGSVEYLRAAGIQILNTYRLPPTLTDVSGVVSDLRVRTPDALICTTHQEDSALVTQQLVATGTSVKLLFLALGPEIPAFRANLGKYAEGLTFNQYWKPTYRFGDPFFGSTANYYKYYTTVTDRKETYHTAGASLCITCYVKAIEDAGSLAPDKVRDTLAALNYESFYGQVKFTADGDGDAVLMGAVISQVQKSGLEVVFPPKVATAKLVYPIPNWATR
jgi:branched-chain amino acid transport system substrate-binding protein